MSVKEITGLLTILPDKENKNQSLKEELQAGNTAFRSRTLARTLFFWNNNSGGSNLSIRSYPWKNGGFLEDADINVGHSIFTNGLATLVGNPLYPATLPNDLMSVFDYTRFRATQTTTVISSATLSRVHAGLSAYDVLQSTATGGAFGGDGIVSASDIPVDYTQIGIVYAHPLTNTIPVGGTLVTAVGTNFVTYTASQWWDNEYVSPTRWGVLRIASGADAGIYFVQNVDFNTNRLYLRNLDGTLFVGKAAATIAATELYIGPGRTTYFNEVSIIPFSTGHIITGGRFHPAAARSSFILKVKIEKTGSTEFAAAAEQQGSYTIALKPWTHGEYDYGLAGYDLALTRASGNEGSSATNFFNHTYPFGISAGVGANVMLLDEVNQRMWMGNSNIGGDSAIVHWRWRTLESPREVANYLGTAGHASFTTPTPVLNTGDGIWGGTIDSKQWVYFAVHHATLGNGGVIIIKPNLTTLQYTEAAPTGTGDTIGGTAPNMTLTDSAAVFSAQQVGQSVTIASATTGANNGTFLITGWTSATQITYQNLGGVAESFPGTWTVLGVPDSQVSGIVADKTRTRVSTNDVSTTVATDQVNSASSAFTASDIGRVIKITGGTNNNGIYKIASVPSGTQVTVTTLAGDVVSFGSGGTGGTYEIGDRLYMMYSNASNGLNKINYTETMAPGTFLSRTFTSTAGLGATCPGPNLPGENQKVTIDPANGNLYWLSSDTTYQINKYDVATNAHTAILITNTSLLSPAGGVVQGGANPATNPGTPTLFLSILVNSKFDEIWVGSDAGHFKIVKSTFAAATIKRYFGTEAGTYYAGVPLTTGTGNGASGIAGTAPTMTLNATGTPFVSSDVGKFIVITGSSTAANNGYFPITVFNSSSSITYTNSGGVAQAGYAGTFHVVSTISQRTGGSVVTSSNTNVVRNYWEQPDGKVQTWMWSGGAQLGGMAQYSREADVFVWRLDINCGTSAPRSGRNKVFDSVGWFTDVCWSSANDTSRWIIGGAEVQYQWTGSAWTPKEMAYAGTPNKSFADTTNPLCAAKPIHSALEDTLYGVQIGFVRQGILIPATPANNEFLGRMGQTRITASDGATTLGANTFAGSSFVAGDTGRILRIESGGDANTYVMTFVNAGQVTLKTMAGATFAGSATVGSLVYTVWDAGSLGSNAGPEEMTVILADGVSKDNTQDITGFTYEGYHFKTRLHENDEPRKFTVPNPLAVPGSLATKVYWENYGRLGAGIPQYDAATSNHLKLPAAEHPLGRQALDGVVAKYMRGANAMGLMYSNQGMSTNWSGTQASGATSTAAAVLGYSLMVDFGKDVEVGFARLRLQGFTVNGQLVATVSNNGLRANIYKANNAGGVPASSITSQGVGVGTSGITGTAPTMTLTSTGTPFSGADVGKFIVITGAALAANNGTFPILSSPASNQITYTNASGAAATYAGTWYVVPTANVRTSGSASFNLAANAVNTTALTTGDFLGPVSLTPSTPAVGSVISGQSTFTDTTNSPFLAAHVGQILQITAGPAAGDIGSYRVMSLTSSSIIVIRNLDQTDKTWVSSSSSVTYVVRDGVQDEDMIVSVGARLEVDRLLTPTTLQVRVGPEVILTSQNWICVKPSWEHVKRISYSTEGAPPDVKNNGTWVSVNGREEYLFNASWRVHSDFADLPPAKKTGRFWKFSAIPRFDVDGGAYHDVCVWEFFDAANNRLATSNYTMVDQSRNDVNADFLFDNVNRADFIQSANDAVPGATFNGNVDLTGANGDTLTLNTGGNKFLGFKIGPSPADGSVVTAGVVITSASSSFPLAASVGRFVRITGGTVSGGVNNGFYRIGSATGTTLTVTNIDGTAVTTFITESGLTLGIHEGINAGGVSPDKFVFLEDGREFTLLTINNALTTLTFAETLQPLRTNKTWEIRRPGYQTASATTEATKTARLLAQDTTYPVQTGDMIACYTGPLQFFPEDVGTGFQRTDGSIAGGSGVITGSGFSPDDVGRLLYVVSGTATQANVGVYEISVFTSATQVTVKNHYTGAAVSFTADSGASSTTYQIYGDRRFRLTRFVVGLRA